MDCIDLFKRAAVALQTDSRYLVLDQTRKANDKDEELQNLIGEFNLFLQSQIARVSLTSHMPFNIIDSNRKLCRTWASAPFLSHFLVSS